MGIGLGIVLIVAGAVLSFSDIVDNAANTNLDVVGYILLAAGALACILALIMNAQRNNTSHTTVVEHKDAGLPPEADRRR